MRFFHPNCTLPATSVQYVGAPNVRSTLDILWSPLATIIACTYSVLHLNVPEQRLGRDPGLEGDIKWGAARLWTSLKWTIATILAPEYILALSVVKLESAKRQLKLLRDTLPSNNRIWTVTHILFADMGGFVLLYKDVEVDNKDQKATTTNTSGATSHETSNQPVLAVVDAADAETQHSSSTSVKTDRDLNIVIGSDSANAVAKESTSSTAASTSDRLDTDRSNGDLEKAESDDPERGRELDTSPSRVWHLDAYVLRKAIEEGHLSSSMLHAEEILDKSKSDLFTKSIAMIQITYFVVVVLARAIEDLAISQLELGVTAFVACSFFTYCLNFSKPKGVCTAITIKDYGEEPLPLRIKELTVESKRDGWLRNGRKEGSPIANDVTTYGDGSWLELIILTFVSVVIEAIHLAAWNFEFPTLVDSWLWRGAALVSGGGLLLIVLEILVSVFLGVLVEWVGSLDLGWTIAFWAIVL